MNEKNQKFWRRDVDKNLSFFRNFPGGRTDPFTDHGDFDYSESDGDDPPPLTTAKTDFPGQPTTPSPFVFGAKLLDAKARFANRFKSNRRNFLNDIKEKTGSIKFVNTKRNRAKINEFKRRRPIPEEIEEYDDPEPRPTARSTLSKTFAHAPIPTRRPDTREKVTSSSPGAIDDTDPEPATTANPPKGILNQAIIENKRRIKAQILKQKKEISRAGIIPPPRKIILLNRKQALEAKNAQLEAKPKKEFKVIDAEELFDRLKEKNAPTTSTVTPTPSATETANKANVKLALDIPVEENISQETITESFTSTSTATTLAPILEQGPSLEAAFEAAEKDSSTNPDTTKKQSTKIPSSVENTPILISSTQNNQAISVQHKSLGDILAALPKEKLEKFKKYLLTLNKKEKKLISKTLQNNLEAARKLSTTTASPNIDNKDDAVIDLGILGSFQLEKSKRTIFKDEIIDNQIRKEKPSPVFRPQ